MADERRRFVEYVSGLESHDCLHSKVFPTAAFYARNEQKDDGFDSHNDGRTIGMAVASIPGIDSLVTLHEHVMDHPDAYQEIRRTLARQNIRRVLELREWGDRTFFLELANFMYNGAEGFLRNSSDTAWIVYASHESSITFGGSMLIEAMRSFLPSFDRYLYKGPFLEAYEGHKG